MLLEGKTVVLGVTGGIAVYKACDIVSSLVKLGADVYVVMTASAREFVTPLTFETLSGHKVVVSLFDKEREWEVEHIALAKKADIFLVAPCTANMVGKLAAGIADDFLSTTLMAFTGPVLIAPAMNTNMYDSPAYRNNEAELLGRGYSFAAPAAGRLACGDTGKGKLAPVEEIVDQVKKILLPKRDFEGKTVVVTAGGTRADIDPVRFIANSSSGKMGKAIATAALQRGAKVVFIAGNVNVPLPAADKLYQVKTTQEMGEAVFKELPFADALIMAAAPCDYRLEPSKQKLKAPRLTLELAKDMDIAAEAGKRKGGCKLVIFAAESENLLDNAAVKLKKKQADLCVANDITAAGAGFDAETNIASILTADKVESYPKMPKSRLAELILDKLADLYR